MGIFDCTASSKGGIDLKEMTNKGLTDGETPAVPMCAQEKADKDI